LERIIVMKSLIKVAGGAVRGHSHEKEGMPCQDNYYVWREKNKKAAGIALADGAGSSKHSQIGAACATESIIPFVMEGFDNYFLKPEKTGSQITQYLSRKLAEIADMNGLKFKDLSCTLLFVCVKRSRKTIRFVAGHIGDGVIVHGNAHAIYVLSEPTRGEFANTTFFLTGNNENSSLK
jgi:serine/threonine protein phosphatase PrpC